MSNHFIYAKHPDGSEAIINLSEIQYASFRDNPDKPQLYLKFGKEDGFTVAPDMARNVWEIIRRLQNVS